MKVLRNKSGVHDEFVWYHKWFERQFNGTIRLFYSDNGGEFVALTNYLLDNGIQDEYSAPLTPEQNGVAERLNRTILYMTRSIMDQASLPPMFSAEAVTTAVQLCNNTGIHANDFVTPLERLTNKKPVVRHLRVFGSEAWINIAKQKKLGFKARKGIVLRCMPRGNYRVWDID